MTLLKAFMLYAMFAALRIPTEANLEHSQVMYGGIVMSVLQFYFFHFFIFINTVQN